MYYFDLVPSIDRFPVVKFKVNGEEIDRLDTDCLVFS